MNYEIKFSKTFAKQLDRLNTTVLKRFYGELEQLQHNPYPSNEQLDTKKLKGTTEQYRLRVGKYRFLYTIVEEQVLIYFYAAGSRGDIYK